MAALLVCGIQAFGTLLRAKKGVAQQLQEINDAKPRVRLRLPGAVHVEMVNHVFHISDGSVLQITVPFLRIRFWNDPENPFPKATAKGVRAFVDFFYVGNSVPCLRMSGRWAESTQPPEYSALASKDHLLETTFGFGQEHVVDIAYVSGIDGRCYAWNNDNYPNFHNPHHHLDGMGYCVAVRLRGELFDETFKFSFYINNGKFRFTQPL